MFSLSSLREEIILFLDELIALVLVRTSALLFGLWFRRMPGPRIPPATDPLLLESATILAGKIRAGKLKSVDIVRAYIKRIQEVNPVLNAVVHPRFEDALAEAAQVDHRVSQGSFDESASPLLGVPFTVKNSVAVKGCVHDAGSFYMKGQQAAEDAAVVSLMLRAGAIPVAISNVPELCMSSDCRNMLYGVTSNPYDTNRSPGGSSGGEGSLLGSAASVVGVGTDFAGSIRLPAYRCGIFGHKPTHGVVSCDGIIPKSGEAQMKLITPGPMCRYAEDLLPVLRVMAGQNAAALGLDKPVDLKKLKIYYVVDNGNKYFTSLCKEQSQAVLKAVKCLENLCEAKSQRVTFEEMRRGVFIWIASFGPSAVPFASLFKNFTGSMNPLSELLLKLVGRSHHTMSAIWIALGERLGKGATPVAVEDLVGQGREFVRKLEDLLGDDGVLIFPCSGTKVPYHNQLFSVYKNLPFTCLFNTARMPVTACPLYLDQEGMPVGVQVVAARFKDRLCLAVARELEKEFGGWRPAGTRSCS
ncbi:hypothetical protein ISCGN_013015 [Ixodes scapularis]